MGAILERPADRISGTAEEAARHLLVDHRDRGRLSEVVGIGEIAARQNRNTESGEVAGIHLLHVDARVLAGLRHVSGIVTAAPKLFSLLNGVAPESPAARTPGTP